MPVARGMGESVFEALAWAALLVGVWVTTLTSVSAPDMVTAACCALACGIAVTVVRRRAPWGPWRPSPPILLWLAWLAPAIVMDTFRVFGLAWRHASARMHGGAYNYGPPHFETTVLPAAAAGSARDQALVASATLAISATPSSYVVDVVTAEENSASDDRIALRIHAPVSGWPSIQERVTR